MAEVLRLDSLAALLSRYLQFTSADNRQHWIGDDALILGRLSGYYVALCGVPLLPASLTAPPGRWCDHCRYSPLLS